ncbi:MAG: hypothetical protein LQ343_000236 [Gyalolechia ehrenbergii]|nr:MAG: hypothetical protein LQ343_000236 [Gyalolechia ehrenbergii]
MSINHSSSLASGDPSSIEDVEKLVQQLYLPGSPQRISDIQNSLQQLQRTDKGWYLADALLQSRDEKVRFFGALTFTVKINSDCHKYHDRLGSTLDDVVYLLRTSLQLEPNLDIRLAEEAVKCFQAWVTYAHGVWLDKAVQLAPLRTMTPYTIRLLWHEDLSEVTADCLGDILNPFSKFFTAKDLEILVGFLISEQAQRQLSTLLGGEFESEPMAVARLLLAYGDAMIQDLVKSPDSSTVQLVMQELLQLLACEGSAGADDDICTPALEFWQSYTEFLIDSLYGTEDQKGPWMDTAKSYVVQAIEFCWVKVRMPAESVWTQWTSDAKGEFKAFRADVEDLLQSSYTLLGTSIFDRLANLANEALKNHAGLHLEATLFCLNALSECISDENVVDVTLSGLFGSELFANMMDPTLAIPSKTQQTAVTTIVSFTAFFERNTQFLPPMLTFLFESLQVHALAAVAAKAIYSTCDSCRSCLVTEVGVFLHQYEVMLGLQGVQPATKERVIGAIAAIVQAIPSHEDKVRSFAKLIDFVDRDVKACQESVRAGSFEQAQEKGLCALRCLVSMGKSMQEPDGAAIDLERETSSHEAYDSQSWVSAQERIVRCLYAVGQSLDRDGEVIEASCQVLRTGYKETSPGPFVFPPKTTEDFVRNSDLQTPRLELVLDAAGAMLTRYTRTTATIVDSTAIAILLRLLQLTAAMGNNPANEPEVSASCIDLTAKYIPHYLHIFLHSQCREHIPNLIMFSLQAMICQEIMPRRSAAFFWASLLQRYELSADLQAMVDSILERYGPQAALVIIHNISGEAARSELETLADPLKKMVFAQPRARQWLSDALYSSTFPSSKVGDAEKRTFLQQIMRQRFLTSITALDREMRMDRSSLTLEQEEEELGVT